MGRLLVILSSVAPVQVHADQLIFGSFRSAENASNWARKLTSTLGTEIFTEQYRHEGVQYYRVQTEDLADQALSRLARQASSAGVEYWRLSGSILARGQGQPPRNSPRLSPPARIAPQVAEPKTPSNPSPGKPADRSADQSQDPDPSLNEGRQLDDQALGRDQATGGYQIDRNQIDRNQTDRDQIGRDQIDFRAGLEGRWFHDTGINRGDHVTGSLSLQAEYYRAWANDRKSFTLTPFVRVDSADSRRSHVDIREMFFSYVGSDWDLHIGAKRVFWGVTEFHHLVDVVNQTDLVENIDGEDKLGQPMVQFSSVRDWGVLDLYLLTGFRERTFASREGRLSLPVHIDTEGQYESGAEDLRVDGAVRWSHHIGPIEFGVHHFSGTSREPLLVPYVRGGELALSPYYPVIDQTGVDAQAILGDWVFKLEGLTRSGYGDRYSAFNVGFEKTLVGLFGSSADLGLVAEYMYDDRGDAAVNTFFENDIALGGRFALNDFADTQALLGVIYDADHGDFSVSLEGSRQLAEQWHINVEARVFGGGRTPRGNTAMLAPLILTDPEYKSSWLQQEDYLQIELIKYF